MTTNNEEQIKYCINTTTYNANIINEKRYIYNDNEYSILNYDKNSLQLDVSYNSLYRSIIVSYPECKLLSFSLPKSISREQFEEKYEYNAQNIYVNEIIEGTMINLFYDNRIQKWLISTKSAIGCNYCFFRNDYENNLNIVKKTFYNMFLDALRYDENTDINDIIFIKELSKNYCYSFVLQHPENHIVLNIEHPIIYLVAVYKIQDFNNITIIPNIEFEKWNCFSNGVIEFPKQINILSYLELTNKYCSIHNDNYNVGIMMFNLKTGERCNIKNPNYEELKIIRGNNPNLQYQYLCLRRLNKVKEFLTYFPRYNNLFKKFNNSYNELIINTHKSYISYYVNKEKIQISKKYFPHIYKIHHEIYIPSLNTENKVIVRLKVIKNYFEKYEPRELLYHITYHARNDEVNEIL